MVHYGGSFAPPLSDTKLSEYQAVINTVDRQSPIREAMQKLHDCAMAWWNQPESTGGGAPHPSGKGIIISLDEPVRTALWDSVPWDHELTAWGNLFDSLTDTAVRNAAFHLLWFGWELYNDREPITTDKL